MVTPEPGPLVSMWQFGVLSVTILGIVLAWSHDSLVPWLLFLASKVVATVLFFGYARQGGCVVPVVALCAAMAAERLERRSPRLARALPVLVLGLLAALVGTETARWARPPVPTVDGRRIETVDPFRDLHRDQRVRFD
jgi:hypothetical protein